MLDPETRKRIDNARDILVGKVPDPKSQVEQITIALIYKFMDDMDKEAEELGGRATFFKGEFAKYSWSNIFDPKLGGYELINLYGEAITRMNQNKNIPQLFRDIFKNAFLPYRDPETLKSFLKEINDFHYDHSERLGDAFEYLLSVLGVQGDAGSLRTPRHIIDFIVKVIAPKKNETILDPACGTAGFLISAYKHIRDQNTDKRKGNQLTPDDRKRLMNSIVGHDISPDMVRLSLVNMYLHGFQNPKIYEYDTLTSDERWNETYDIILANPPFMTPKGGIRPHKRFSIQANRSEVLFVDYIMEHIATDGRAGVIVPEGIIFQSANAYKALRKALVENGYIYAVVSLPAGVFNPYSGVKTSILLMDRTLAKKAKDILFVKIENDGFDLGAQRRELDKSDLTEALKIIQTYQESIRKGKEFNVGAGLKPAPTGKQTTKAGEHTGSPLQKLFHIVLKTQIAESGDYNLTGDRYRERIIHSHKDWPMAELGKICVFEYGKPLKEENRIQGSFPVYGSNGIVGWHNEFLVKAPFLVVGRKGSAGSVLYSDHNGFPIDTSFFIKLENEDNVLLKYLYYCLLKLDLKNLYSQSGVPGLNRNDAYRFKIPLPPLSVQKEIVAEIGGYQKIIDGAKQVVENYKPQINIDPDWEMVTLHDVCDRIMDGTHFSPRNTSAGERLYITAKHIKEFGIELKDLSYVSEEDHRQIYERCPVVKGDVLYIKDGATTGIATINSLDQEFSLLSSVAVLRGTPDKLDNRFLCYYLNSTKGKTKMLAMVSGVAITRLTLTKLNEVQLPLPPLKIQKQIVAQIEEEQKLVEANKKLIEIFEEKIKAKITEVWGEEAPSVAEPELLMAAEDSATYGK